MASSSRTGLALAAGLLILTAIALSLGDRELAVTITTLFLLGIIIQFLIFVVRLAQSTTTATLALAAYVAANLVSILLLFANLYRWLGVTDSASKGPTTFLTSLYYSVSTWTTLTYGDIVPNAITRPIAALQAITGYVVMAFLIAIIVSMLQNRK